jgi:glycine/D-amino acid oxidase-like deaminating enzyme
MFDVAISDCEATAELDPELGKMVTIVRPGDSHPELKDLRLGTACVGAVVQKNAASLWPYKLIAWMIEKLLAGNNARADLGLASFNLQTKTPVNHIQSLEDGTWIVHTDRGMVAANKVLLATNAYTSHLLPEFSDLIVPVRGQMSSLTPPPSLSPDTGKPLASVNSYGFIGNGGQKAKQDDYLVQQPFRTDGDKISGGELMFGGGRGHAAAILGVGVADDTFIDPAIAQYLRSELNTELGLQNGNEELKASYEWTGIMGFSRDGKSWCGEVPKEMGGGKGLFICAGFTGHGMANASVSAKYVADLVSGRQTDNVVLPKEFIVSQERAKTARGYAEVRMADLLPDDYHC